MQKILFFVFNMVCRHMCLTPSTEVCTSTQIKCRLPQGHVQCIWNEEGEMLRTLYIKKRHCALCGIIKRHKTGQVYTSYFCKLPIFVNVNSCGWGGISRGMQPDAIEHQTQLLMNIATFINTLAWLSLVLCIFHAHKISVEMTSVTSWAYKKQRKNMWELCSEFRSLAKEIYVLTIHPHALATVSDLLQCITLH